MLVYMFVLTWRQCLWADGDCRGVGRPLLVKNRTLRPVLNEV